MKVISKNGIEICNINIFEIVYLNCLLPEIVRDDPAVNKIHLRRLEEYQIGEAAKCREKARAIEKEMRDVDERAQKHWSTK